MRNLEIRPLVAADLPYLLRMDHVVESTHVWHPVRGNSEAPGVNFRPYPLPRPVRVTCLDAQARLEKEWRHRPAVWLALRDGIPLGYAALTWAPAADQIWLAHVVVDTPWRRQGVGRALLRHALRWARQHGYRRLVFTASFRNHPAISLALSIHLHFLGFQYGYYPNGDTALFLGYELG